MAGQHPQQVASLAGTQADHRQRARRGVIERRRDLRLNRPQAPDERRTRTVVSIVKFVPVHDAQAYGGRACGAEGYGRRAYVRTAYECQAYEWQPYEAAGSMRDSAARDSAARS